MNTTIKSIIATAFALTLVNNAQAQVANISAETFAQYGKDEAYFVAEVECEQGGALRAIQRKTDGNNWCGKDVAGYCDASKDAAAKKVCGTEYGSAISLLEDKTKAEEVAAEAQARAESERERAAVAERERAEQARRSQQQQARAAQAERERKAAAAPLKKKISIEEQLITIEQEKLDLRRQELELQRRAVEIQKELDKKG